MREPCTGCGRELIKHDRFSWMLKCNHCKKIQISEKFEREVIKDALDV